MGAIKEAVFWDDLPPDDDEALDVLLARAEDDGE
jgi:hypothetical protein